MTTGIEWTDETWNPIVGCSKTSPGCDHCYAIGVAHRAMQPAHVGVTVKPEGGPVDWTGEVRCLPERLDQPLHWRKPRRIFVNSMSDLFHPDVPDEFILAVFQTMARAERHVFQVLTKRPQRMASFCGRLCWDDVGPGDRMLNATPYLAYVEGSGEAPLDNVWLGTSIESNRYAFRADHLRATPAAVRWISAEPLLGPLDALDLTGIDWLVVGGESGPGARPMHPGWVRDLRDRCTDYRCPRCRASFSLPLGTSCENHRPERGPAFLFKQWGSWGPAGAVWSRYDEAEVGTFIGRKFTSPGIYQRCDPALADDVVAVTSTSTGERLKRVGKKAAGRTLDGRTWDEYPNGDPR